MSTAAFQPDDELLSAYLDGQLDADELREVEAWLARDEAARTLVEELRSVSQAVQSLPRQSVPEAWRAQLAARLDQVSPPTTESPPPGDSMSNLPVGRTSRGWWWSVAAVAAAVAIVVFLPDNGEREVAMETADKAKVAAGSEPATEAVPEMAAADAIDGVDDMNLGLDSAMSEDALADIEPPSADAFVEADEEMRERAAGDSLAEFAPARPTELAFDRESLMRTADEGPYLIVWADVPPETLRRQQINHVLHSNGIQVEAETDLSLAAAEPMRQQIERRNTLNRSTNFDFGGGGGFGGARLGRDSRANSSRFSVPDFDSAGGEFVPGNRGLREPAEAGQERAGATRKHEREDRKDDDNEPEGEALLVEATVEQIAGCLSDMQLDRSNFDTITVESVTDLPPLESVDRLGSWSGKGQTTSGDGMATPETVEDPSTATVEEELATNQPIDGAGGRMESRSEGIAEAAPSDFSATTLFAGKGAQLGNAYRLETPKNWYFDNSAPQNESYAYQLPELQSDAPASEGTESKQSELGDYRQQQVVELNSRLARQGEQQASGKLAVPLNEKQPVQVLFVLRNRKLPAAEPTSAPPATEAAPADSNNEPQ